MPLMSTSNKTVIFLGDGMADEPLDELDGRTPLQAANTPGMDRIAAEGCSGTLFTLPEAFPTSSEVANMSVLGCDLESEYPGRGPLEAAGRGVDLKPGDIAFRMNLVTLERGVLTDFSGGHIAQEDADALIGEMNRHFGAESIRFHPGVSYRSLLVLSGPEFSPDVSTEKPDDNQGERLDRHLPVARSDRGKATALLLRRLMEEAPAILEDSEVNRKRKAAGLSPANGVWPWNGGRAPALRSLNERYGISGAVISAVDVIMGLGKCLGMDTIEVPGATGYIDTNYEGKADAAVEALKSHDFVYLHVEAIDEVSHEQRLDLKLKAIEDFDARVVRRVLDACDAALHAAVLPDHPVPIALGKHTRVPVPVAVRRSGLTPDEVMQFDEAAARHGRLGALYGSGLMDLLFRGAG